MLHKEIPFLRIGLPFCAGIVCGLYFSPGVIFFVITGIIILIGFCSSLFFNKYLTNLVYGISLTSALFILGIFLYTKEKADISILGPEEAIFSGYLSEYPEEKDNSYKMIFRIEKRIDKVGQNPVKGSLLIYCKKFSACSSMLPGDRLMIRCKPTAITSRGNPYEFDYRFYMENQGIRYYAFADSSNIISHLVPAHRKLVHSALIIREKIINMYRERGIKGERLALVAAITLGQKNMLDPEQKLHFIKAGVMHIMAVSGLHAVILSLFVFKLLFFMKRRLHILRVIITLIILWSFAFVTGLTPSVLRATLMFSFLQTGNIIKRPVNGINSVLASAFILAIIRPSVIFDAGFLLSYSAVIYIISFYRDFYLKIQFRHRVPDLIWQSAAVTIVAQAGTLPLTIMLFNRFPTWFILSNIIIVPLSSVVIIIGCLVPLTFPVHFLSQILARILDYLTGLTELLTEKASSLPLSTIENIGLTTGACILLTITIFVFLRFLLNRKSISILYPLTILMIFILTGSTRSILTKTTDELIVYNTVGHSTIGIRTGRILNLYSDSSLVSNEVKKHCATLNLEVRNNILHENNCHIKAGEKNILITSDLKNSLLKMTTPDILIIRGLKPSIENNVHPAEKFEAVIISSESSPSYKASGIIRSLPSDTTIFVKNSGAFYKKL